jgi:hypothetical protein
MIVSCVGPLCSNNAGRNFIQYSFSSIKFAPSVPLKHIRYKENDMKKGLLITLLVLGILIVAGALVCTGVFIGRRFVGASANIAAYPQDGWYGDGEGRGFGPGMMGHGMMDDVPYRNGLRGNTTTDENVTPLTTEQAYQAGSNYLATLNLPDLKISEVIVFDNIAVVRVLEQSTSIGAFDLFVDPVNQSVIPTMGPSTVWNLKYGSIVHVGMMNGWMANQGTLTVPTNVTADMTVTVEQAVTDAQVYLDNAVPGATADTNAQAFYGYYSIKVMKDGNVIGILSVNGTSGQVFMPNWFGTYVNSQDYTG